MKDRTNPPAARRRRADRVRRAAGATALLLVALLFVGALVDASTTVTERTAPVERVVHAGAPAAAPVRLTGETSVLLRGRLAGVPAAGVQAADALGAVGTTTALAACARSPCTDPYRSVGGTALAAGEYSERLEFAVTQPATGGTSTGFLLSVAVRTNSGWYWGYGYFATGVSGLAAGATVDLELYVGLGVAVAPTVLATEVAADACSSATSCP